MIMTNKILLLVAVIALSCTPQGNEPPEPDCMPVDFSGMANWKFVGDSLYVEMLTGDFIGNLAGVIVDTDSGRTVFASAAGTFIDPANRPPKFERTGYMSLRGLITFEDGEYAAKLYIVIGMEGFSDATGYFDFTWRAEDEHIYHVGTLCFADAE